MTEPVGYDIRYTDKEDLPFLRNWFLEEKNFDGFPFTEEEMEEPLRNWIGFSKFRASLTGMLDNVPCAIGTLFLMPYRKVAHHASFYLIVKKEVRRQGIGTSMVRNLLHLAKTRFRLESLHAEVFEPSPLLSILEKLKFERFARQEHYVKREVGDYLPRSLWEYYFAENP